MSDQTTQDLLARAGRELPVGPPPVGEVVARGRRQRRARRTALAATAAAVALAGAVSVSVVDSDPEPLPLDNGPAGKLGLTWWADDTLHLGTVAVPVTGVVALTDPGPGAAYVDERDRVVLVDDDGSSRVIGEVFTDALFPTGLIASDPDRGWLFWLGEADGAFELVAYDAAEHRVLARQPWSGGWPPASSNAFVIEVSGGVAYFDTRGGNEAWDVVTGTIERISRASYLLDVDGPRRVHLAGGDLTSLAISDPEGRKWQVRWPAGIRARLSPDGAWLVTLGADGTVRLLDATTGRDAATGLPAGTEVTGFGFGSGSTVTFAVGDGLVTCTLGTGSCRSPLPTTGQPVLPD